MLEKFLIATGIIATPGGQKSDEEEEEAKRRAGKSGKIWVANLKQNLTLASFEEVMIEGSFRSPVILAGGAQILALKGEKIVRITILDKSVEELETIPGILKLVGQSKDNPADVMILLRIGKGGCIGVAMFSTMTKKLTLIPYGDTTEDEARVFQLLIWERVYDGGVTLLEKQDEVGEGENKTRQFNIFLIKQNPNSENKISHCVRKNCIQPTFLNSPRMVAYVEEE